MRTLRRLLARRWLATRVLVPALLAVVVGANVDFTALPGLSPERFSAVLLVDGQAYFGHLDDNGAGGTVRLSDVYYFVDAQKGSTGMPLGLVKRGAEAHQPTDVMRINRDKVLAVERLAASSQVVAAIAAQRGLGKDTQGGFLERRVVGGSGLLGAQRAATENALARGFKKAADQLRTALTELVLPVSAETAAQIAAKAAEDLRSVRAAALSALATSYGMSQADADAYVRTTGARLDAPSDGIPATLLAPDLYAIVSRADQLYTQVSDGAITQMTRK